MKTLNLFILSLIACCSTSFCRSMQAKTNYPVTLKTDSFAKLGNSEIYYKCKGSGSLSVVFVSGLGDDHTTWNRVQDSVSNFASTFSYDRSGLGKSQYHHEKKDLLSMTKELHALVGKAGVRKPFIVVGHSLGCQIVKEYAALYPSDISGVIFCDPGYNEENLKAIIPDSLWRSREATLKKYLPVFNPAQNEELRNVNRCAAICDSIKQLKKVPIVLFTGTLITDFPASQQEHEIKSGTHVLWLKSLPWAQHIMVPESRHYIQEDAPVRVITAIKQMRK